MAEINIEPIKETEMRDIHYINSKYKNQIIKLKKERSKIIFKDWLFFEEWIITQGIHKITIIKKLFDFQIILNLHQKANLKAITEKELINLCYNIMVSQYSQSVKRDVQIVLRQYLLLFSKTRKREHTIKHIIKVMPSVEVKPPKELITHDIFNILLNNLQHEEFKTTTKILYSTGMRIIEAFNIIKTPQNIEFVNDGVWINTLGKRTKNNKKGEYRYFMVFFVDEFKEYIKDIPDGEYIIKYSYDYYYKCLKKAAKDGNLDIHIYPHLFRHTTATALFKQYSQQNVYKVMNWSPNSRMAEVYSNLYDKDIHDTLEDYKKRQKERF